MIERVEKIDGVGLFHNSGPSPAFGKLTLLFGENGRGKSTLAMLIRAAETADSASVIAKRTIDGGNAQLVKIATDAGVAVFANGAWATGLTDIQVFDSKFIEQNVYSGDEIGAQQRARLLEFCLGEGAVALQQEFNGLTDQQSANQAIIRDLTASIKLLSGSVTLERYLGIQRDDGIEDRIASARRDLAAAEQQQRLAAQSLPDELPHLQDIEELADLLMSSPGTRARQAETLVKERARLLNFQSTDWLETGHQHAAGDTCPYCGQGTAGVPLIEAYEQFFTEQFSLLARRLSEQASAFEAAYGPRARESLRLANELVASRFEAWSAFLDLADLSFPLNEIERRTEALWTGVWPIIEAKRSDLAGYQVAGSAIQSARVLLGEIATLKDQANVSIRELRRRVGAFRERLGTIPVDRFRADLANLEVAKHRHEEPSLGLVEQYLAAVETKQQIEIDRAAKRAELDTAINATMALYFDKTNSILRSFSSSISIGRMGHNYTGGHPRLDYALSIRNQEVGSGDHTFGNTFSDGDRRSLALAFFLAKAEIDAGIALKTFYVDDPMSSLDGSRRSNTIEILVGIADRANQVVVASHDAFFLQEFRDRWRRAPQHSDVAIQIRPVGAGYSDFEPCDIDELCRSIHVQRLFKLEHYLSAGAPQDQLDGLAQSLRPLLEGYLHRRFPNSIPRGTMLGIALNSIETAPLGSPLHYLSPSMDRMIALKNYANQFHHDTNPSASTIQVSELELRAHAESLVELLYSGELI